MHEAIRIELYNLAVNNNNNILATKKPKRFYLLIIITTTSINFCMNSSLFCYIIPSSQKEKKKKTFIAKNFSTRNQKEGKVEKPFRSKLWENWPLPFLILYIYRVTKDSLYILPEKENSLYIRIVLRKAITDNDTGVKWSNILYSEKITSLMTWLSHYCTWIFHCSLVSVMWGGKWAPDILNYSMFFSYNFFSFRLNIYKSLNFFPRS